jgi:hypothetical protein
MNSGIRDPVSVGERAKQLAMSAVVVALASVWLASRESTHRILLTDAPLWFTSLRVGGGPLTGWAQAAMSGSILMALWGLVPATFFTVGPLVLWARLRSWFWLAVATLAWIAAGDFYAIAIWV